MALTIFVRRQFVQKYNNFWQLHELRTFEVKHDLETCWRPWFTYGYLMTKTIVFLYKCFRKRLIDDLFSIFWHLGSKFGWIVVLSKPRDHFQPLESPNHKLRWSKSCQKVFDSCKDINEQNCCRHETDFHEYFALFWYV